MSKASEGGDDFGFNSLASFWKKQDQGNIPRKKAETGTSENRHPQAQLVPARTAAADKEQDPLVSSIDAEVPDTDTTNDDGQGKTSEGEELRQSSPKPEEENSQGAEEIAVGQEPAKDSQLTSDAEPEQDSVDADAVCDAAEGGESAGVQEIESQLDDPGSNFSEGSDAEVGSQHGNAEALESSMREVQIEEELDNSGADVEATMEVPDTSNDQGDSSDCEGSEDEEGDQAASQSNVTDIEATLPTTEHNSMPIESFEEADPNSQAREAAVSESETSGVEDPRTRSARSVVGVGIGLSPNKIEELQVSEIIAGSSAARDGTVQVGDVIHAVDGFDVYKLSITQVGMKVRGPSGTTVCLTFVRHEKDGSTNKYNVTLSREETRVVEGFLLKKGGSKGGRRNWSQRFFVLREKRLMYFKPKSSKCKFCQPHRLCTKCQHQAELKGTVEVGSVERVDKSESGYDYTFRITSGDRTVLCQASSEAEREDWLLCLSAAAKAN